MEKTNLHKRIMRRVYFISTLKRLFNPMLVKLYILAAIMWQGTQFVSVGHVLDNIAEVSVGSLYQFSTYALTNTEFVVQILMILGSFLLLWALRDLVKRQSHISVGV